MTRFAGTAAVAVVVGGLVILGAGQVGRTAAYHLSREEANEVTVV